MKFITTDDVNSYECVETIKAACPDLIVSVSMNQVIKKEILELPVNWNVNVHCAPLPEYGGMLDRLDDTELHALIEARRGGPFVEVGLGEL